MGIATRLSVALLGLLLQACQPTPVDEKATVVPNDPVINQSLGKLFLAKNKLKPGVYSYPSGLQYSIIKSGQGLSPVRTDRVTLYYQGRYVDGKVFDNQHVQKDPITVPVSDMIPGWQEAVTHMVPGSIWVLYIPGNLAYGERGLPGKVGPNQTLIYTINLLAVSPPH